MKKMMMTLAALLTMTVAVAQNENKECCNTKAACENHQKSGCRPQMQGEDRKPLSAQQRTDMMAKELNLTDKQKAAVLALFEKQEAEMKKILTDEQYQQFQKMHPKHHGPHGHHGPHEFRGPKPMPTEK